MLNSFFVFLWAGLCVSIAYTDCRYRLVYHFQVLIALLLGIFGSYFYGYSLNLGALFCFLCLGFVLWKLGVMGGGDIKLISALSICFGWGEIGMFFFCMSVFGFFIALLTLMFRSKRRVPYAPAIALGHWVVFFDTYVKGFYE